MSTNYIAEFYKTADHNYEDFFTSYVDTEAIYNINKDIKSLNDQLETKREELSRLYAKRYNAKFTPVEKRFILHYESRMAADAEFDVLTGAPAVDANDETCKFIQVGRKAGEFEVIVGYSFPLGAVVSRKYNYKIATNNSRCAFTIISETVTPILEYNALPVCSNGLPLRRRSLYNTGLADDFIRQMYDIPDFKGGVTYNTLDESLRNNASTEVILKTAPMDCMKTLLSFKVDKAEPIHKILGLPKADYDSLVEKGYLKEFVVITQLINGSFGDNCSITRNKDYTPSDFFHYTNSEWIDIIEKAHYWKEELSFNQVAYNEDFLTIALLKAYVGYAYNFREALFYKHYSFGKFMDYVCEESCNQGFQSLESFLSVLKDYLSMCETMGVKPSLYTCYLKQTHDILTRNYKINPTEAQKVSFAKHYEDYKDYTTKDKKYVVTHPATVDDVKQEGYNLNHCVASYILKCCQGLSRILFLRDAKMKTQSLVTIEIVNKSIVQARGASNRPITTEEFKALCEFAKERKLNVRVSPRD